jgi:hypothetical protein
VREIGWWLPKTTPLMQRVIVERALRSIGMLEEPPGSNRGPDIDALNLRAGVPVGSYWCASWAGSVWQDAGAEVPNGYASCDRWMEWAKQTNRWTTTTNSPGCAVLYGKLGDATHIGILVRTSPMILSIEGNTSVEGGGFERNGTAVSLKLVNERDPVLGYAHPIALPTLAKAA